MQNNAREDFQERRRYVRIDCLMAARIVAVEDVRGLFIKRSAALTKNVSAGGLLFKDSRFYDIGHVVVIEIDPDALDDLENNIARVIKTRGYVLGKIVRVERFDDEETNDYGVCFVKIDDMTEDYFELFQELLNKMEVEE